MAKRLANFRWEGPVHYNWWFEWLTKEKYDPDLHGTPARFAVALLLLNKNLDTALSCVMNLDRDKDFPLQIWEYGMAWIRIQKEKDPKSYHGWQIACECFLVDVFERFSLT